MGEHRSNGERKYYLSNLPAVTPIKDLAGAIKARWMCEQYACGEAFNYPQVVARVIPVSALRLRPLTRL